ncbi:MAG: Hpt domain-containing protein [Desulfuromonadales bacterium]|nr:Hpt domain-containing protein [Desulfuromonadales bacterium]
MSIMDELFGFFLEEANDHLRILEEGLLQLEKNPELVEELIEPLFRAAHTLKGSANLVNVTDVGVVAHRLEDLLEGIRDGEPNLTLIQADGMLFALDQMRELIHLRQSNEKAPEGMVADILARLATADSQGDHEEPQTDHSPEVSTSAEEGTDQYIGVKRRVPSRRKDEAGGVRVSMERIESLMGLVGEFTVTKNHLLDRLPIMVRMQEEVDFAGQRLLKEVSSFSERYDYTMPTRSSDDRDDTFEELEFDRYDELNQK